MELVLVLLVTSLTVLYCNMEGLSYTQRPNHRPNNRDKPNTEGTQRNHITRPNTQEYKTRNDAYIRFFKFHLKAELQSNRNVVRN